MTGLDLLLELRSPSAHPSKRRLVAVLDAVFPDAGQRQNWYVTALLGAVDDVRHGAPTPWLSRVQRAAIEAAWKKEGETP